MEELFEPPKLPGAPGDGGWIEERTRYRIAARPKSHFETVIDAQAFFGVWEPGLRASKLSRTAPGRAIEVDFLQSPMLLPRASYPEVLLPFLMRGQPRDDRRRALYAWTSDLFCARVYYETRGQVRLSVPAGTIECHEVWMYPDLNDWIALGSVITRLAKPLLPRYTMYFEAASPHRVVKFEGPFGPPGAPEMLVELAS